MSDFEEGDWYQDGDSRLWEYGITWKTKEGYWSEIDYWICGTPRGREIQPRLDQSAVDEEIEGDADFFGSSMSIARWAQYFDYLEYIMLTGDEG